MALARAGLIADSTTTSGQTTYTLNDPDSPGGGLRTLADAVADGHVSDGDTVYYWVKDTTTEGASLDFEHGLGTVSDSGTTLARTTIIESSNGNNAVSWGGGGTRTVTIGLGVTGILLAASNLSDVDDADTAADNIGAARLNAVNAFSAANTFAGNVSISGTNNLRLLLAGALRGRLSLDTAVVTGPILERYQNDGTTVDSSIKLENAKVVVTGALQDGSGNAYDAFPAGTVMFFGQTAAPIGWTKDTTKNDAALRVVSGTVGSGGSTGLSSSNTGSTTLTIAQIPNHNHTVFDSLFSVDTNQDGSTSFASAIRPSTGNNDQNTSSAGSGNSHTHTLALKYVDTIRATKD